MLAEKGPLKYVIEVKASRDSRNPTLTALAAAGLLQARRYALLLGGQPLVVVGAPRLSQASVRAIGQFLADFGDGAAWGVIDGAGLLELHGPGLETMQPPEIRSRPKVGPGAASRAVQRRADPFSDLNQWCLKLLLSHRLPADLQLRVDGQMIARPIRNSSELARIAGVSPPTAWRLVSSLQENGLLARAEPLEPVRHEMLMSHWKAANLRQGRDIRTRWLFPAKTDTHARLVGAFRALGVSAPRMALGLFAAAEQLGHGFVRGVAPHLLHEAPSSEALERLGLVPAGPGERVDVFVRKPVFPEAVYRGARELDGIPVADIFQVWVDVSAYPARGSEMAAHLEGHVLSRLFSPARANLLADDDES